MSVIHEQVEIIKGLSEEAKEVIDIVCDNPKEVIKKIESIYTLKDELQKHGVDVDFPSLSIKVI